MSSNAGAQHSMCADGSGHMHSTQSPQAGMHCVCSSTTVSVIHTPTQVAHSMFTHVLCWGTRLLDSLVGAVNERIQYAKPPLPFYEEALRS
jgi:hypothetical protein